MIRALVDLLDHYRRERGGSLRETAAAVPELSGMFNGLTPHRPGYLANDRLRRAYVNYYLPVNAEKVARVLSERDRYAPPGKPLRVLDFGCGPGTAALAWILGGRPTASITLVDVVDPALDDARFLCRAAGRDDVRALNEAPRGERFDLILAANVLAETELRLDDLLEPDGHFVVVEPALKDTTRRLMAWRDEKAAGGWAVAAPCVGQARCPMLSRPDLWCHMDVPWPRPALVAEVDRRTGLDKESLKYAYVVLTKTGGRLGGADDRWRVVSNLHREKGKAWAMLCGREGPLCRAEILTRHRGPETTDFFRAGRGDVLEMKAEGESCRCEGPVRTVE